MTSQNNNISWSLIATLTLFLILFRNYLTKVSQKYQPSEPNPAISWMKRETKNTTEFTGNFEVKLEHCGCIKKLKNATKNYKDLDYNQTTCNNIAYQRGPHQNVVAFSYFGDINSNKRWVLVKVLGLSLRKIISILVKQRVISKVLRATSN